MYTSHTNTSVCVHTGVLAVSSALPAPAAEQCDGDSSFSSDTVREAYGRVCRPRHFVGVWCARCEFRSDRLRHTDGIARALTSTLVFTRAQSTNIHTRLTRSPLGSTVSARHNTYYGRLKLICSLQNILNRKSVCVVCMFFVTYLHRA